MRDIWEVWRLQGLEIECACKGQSAVGFLELKLVSSLIQGGAIKVVITLEIRVF